MHKATPKTTRSLRHIAEQKNRPGNFDPDPPYFAQGGVPKTGEVKGAQLPEDQACAMPMPNHPVDQGTPFTLGGKK